MCVGGLFGAVGAAGLWGMRAYEEVHGRAGAEGRMEA